MDYKKPEMEADKIENSDIVTVSGDNEVDAGTLDG